MRLIVIDGLDAAGKDTHAEIIKRKYEQMGERVLIRSHPEDDNWFGRMAKQALLGTGKKDKVRASVFYALDVIRSLGRYYNNEDYDTLIIVRYLMGTAYLSLPLAKVAYKFFKTFLPTSKYMFFLDVSPDEALRRVKKRSAYETFETREELVKVRKKALVLAQDGWYVISTNQPQEKVAAEIERIQKSLQGRAPKSTTHTVNKITKDGKKA